MQNLIYLTLPLFLFLFAVAFYSSNIINDWPDRTSTTIISELADRNSLSLMKEKFGKTNKADVPFSGGMITISSRADIVAIFLVGNVVIIIWFSFYTLKRTSKFIYISR